jgi:hypothetical protein
MVPAGTFVPMALRLTLLLLCLSFLAACSTHQRVADTGLLQKRKFRPGWDLALFERGTAVAPRQPMIRNSEPLPLRLALRQVAPAEVEAQAPLASLARIPALPERLIHPPITALPLLRIQPAAEPVAELVPEAPRVEDPPVAKRWNRLAVPALLASLGSIAIGLFTTSTLGLLLAVVGAILLAGISLRQIRMRDEGGKGFALAALILALLAALATAIAIAVVGFV